MKKNFLLTIFAFIVSVSAFSQNEIQVKENNKSDVQKQIDSLKQSYAKDGFLVIKEASVNMESESEMPVIVPLQEDGLYQFVFVGDQTSRLYEVRMYDWSEKQVAYQQKKRGNADGNIISYSYRPKFSEFHMFKPVQVNNNKKKDLYGYVMLLKRTNAATAAVAAK